MLGMVNGWKWLAWIWLGRELTVIVECEVDET